MASQNGPLSGLLCVELSTTVAGPAAGAMMADWGCDVIKVEPPTGDTFRYTMSNNVGRAVPNDYLNSPTFYAINRGKKSVVLDFKDPVQLAAFKKILACADIFLSNMRQMALAKFGLDAETAHREHPRLVVCAMTGFGRAGPERDAPGYDVGVFYGKSGAAMSFTNLHPKYGDRKPGDPIPLPPMIPGGLGDICTAMSAVAGIGAALTARGTTGCGQIVDTSLLRTGLWANTFDITMTQAMGRYTGARGQHARLNPLLNCYRTADDRVFWLLGLESQRHFPGVASALGREDWKEDPRFNSPGGRAKNCVAFIAALNEAIANLQFDEVVARFKEFDVWWQPSNTAPEAIIDPQVLAMKGLVSLPLGPADIAQGVTKIDSIRGPVDFSSGDTGPQGHVPSLGEHTAEVLKEYGIDLPVAIGQAKL